MKKQDKDNLEAKDLIAREFLKAHFDRIKDWTVGDIRRASRISKNGRTGRNGSLVGAYMLWCAAIDYYGGLLKGPKSNTKTRVKGFVNKYLRKYGNYKASKVYNLRWSLLHYYTPRGYNVLAQQSKEKSLHLKETNRGCSIHLGCAITDLERAVDDFEKHLRTRRKMRNIAFEYYKTHKIIKPVAFEEIKILGECD